MNYRHAFHAGNAADVLKHAVLCLLLDHLRGKPAPFAVLDTHAGIGLYDLDGEAARRTGEADGGIRRLLSVDAPHPALASYLDAVRTANPQGGLRTYPGSPWLALHGLRDQDRLVLAELHPEDAATLRRTMGGDRRVAIHHMDGWLALKAHLPPKEKRGLVLIDPPFEASDEYTRMVQALRLAHGRWPTGQYALWYPVKDRAAVWRLHQDLEDAGIPKVLAAELCWADEGTERLSGSGMILVNPPWRMDVVLSELLPWLHGALGARSGGTTVAWIRGETAPGA